MARSTAPRWLLLIHQLPPSPAYVRVKTARQLQKIGAVAVKSSVYVLPNTEAARESFEWLAKEIAAAGGEATLCESSFVGGTSNEAIEASFHAARRRDYDAVGVEARAALRSLGRAARLTDEKRATGEAALARLRRRLAETVDIDFFGAPGREAVAALVAQLERRLVSPAAAAPAKPVERPRPRGALWVTRRGVHVDRIASAWLIRRFIDRTARFKLVRPKGYRPARGELRFDMFEAEYTHVGELCTFEVLARTFAVTDPAVRAIGEVVHDIDVRDGKYGRAETAGVERLINGLALTQRDDRTRLTLGGRLFDALHEAWKRKAS
ncbi:MAG TPA: chromate resistance protein ChrB domain-containing protein [Polyangia bacterium]|nr:chromate resistance protein ChrB domain-containing protein [Polyangia bacterium]